VEFRFVVCESNALIYLGYTGSQRASHSGRAAVHRCRFTLEHRDDSTRQVLRPRRTPPSQQVLRGAIRPILRSLPKRRNALYKLIQGLGQMALGAGMTYQYDGSKGTTLGIATYTWRDDHY
jgi:hypothetical protein